MSSNHISIKIDSAYVEGVDSLKRSKSIRDLILCRSSKIISTIPILHDINFSAEAGDRKALCLKLLLAFIPSNLAKFM